MPRDGAITFSDLSGKLDVLYAANQISLSVTWARQHNKTQEPND
jgi:hypothetical protein